MFEPRPLTSVRAYSESPRDAAPAPARAPRGSLLAAAVAAIRAEQVVRTSGWTYAERRMTGRG